MFKDKLYIILRTIEESKKRDPKKVLEERVQYRLSRALDAYTHSLNNSYEYLSSKDSLNVLKKLNREG